MMKPIAVLLAPGINCHEETAYAIEQAGHPAETVLVSHLRDGRKCLPDYPAVVIPGGFSYGDHFRTGVAFALLFGEMLQEFVALGRPLLGICNGFQIMMEAGLFDEGGQSAGALVPNANGRFVSRWVRLLVLPGSPWTEGFAGRVLRMPVAHGEGRWLMPDRLPSGFQSFVAYCDENGQLTENYPDNPNGSLGGVAGLVKGNVAAMMPHPERANDTAIGSTDGQLIFRSLVRLAKQ